MRFDPKVLIAPLLATVVLAIMLVQTLGAVHRSGTWSARRAPVTTQVEDPYARLDRSIATAAAGAAGPDVRDPFGFGTVAPVAAGPARPRRVVPPPAPERPVLTAIVWDNDPRALVHWNDRDYTIRNNDLFDQFRVVGIARDQVTLDRAGETVILKRPHQGD